MKKVIAIILLFQIASNNAFGQGFLKLPGIISHYFLHSTEHSNAGDFFDFLDQHYSAGDRHTDGKHKANKDCNLPFEDCGNCCISLDSPVPDSIPSCLTADRSITSAEAICFLPEQHSFQSLDINNIWQPPKIS